MRPGPTMLRAATRVVLTLALAGLLGACGGGGGAPAPGFTFTLSKPSLACRPGQACTGLVVLHPTNGFADPVTYTISLSATAATDGLVADTAEVFSTGWSYTVVLPPGATGGPWTATVTGTSGALSSTAPLTVTLDQGAQPTILLVDDDGSDNNFGNYTPDSQSDVLFRRLLDAAGQRYDVAVAAGGENDGPTFDTLSTYQTVIWYTGGEYPGSVGAPAGMTLSTNDATALALFLDAGGTKLLLFAQNLGMDYGSATVWGSADALGLPPAAVHFIMDDLGCAGLAGDTTLGDYTVSGVAGQAADGYSLRQVADSQVYSFTDLIQPKVGVDVLLTMVPTTSPETGGANDGTPPFVGAVAVANQAAGDVGTSVAVLVTFPFENIADGTAAKTTRQELFDLLLAL